MDIGTLGIGTMIGAGLTAAFGMITTVIRNRHEKDAWKRQRDENRATWLRDERLKAFSALSEQMVQAVKSDIDPTENISTCYLAAGRTALLISDRELADRIETFPRVLEMREQDRKQLADDPNNRDLRDEIFEEGRRLVKDCMYITERLRLILEDVEVSPMMVADLHKRIFGSITSKMEDDLRIASPEYRQSGIIKSLGPHSPAHQKGPGLRAK